VPETEERKAPTLTHSQAVNRLREITAELERLAELDPLTPDDEAAFEDLTREFTSTDEHRKRMERDVKLAMVRAASGGLTSGLRLEAGSYAPGGTRDGSSYDRDAILEPDSVEDHRFRNPWNTGEVREFGRSTSEVGAEYRARALSAIEKMPAANDAVRKAATDILEQRVDHPDKLARQILLTSSPAYLRAWSKLARNAGHSMTADEASALDAVQSFRAMSLTDAAGGFLVPFQLDPTVIITSAGSRNDIRRRARQVVATGDVWNGISSTAVAWSWDAEAAEVSDDTTTFAQPAITIYKAAGFVPISLEAMQDEANVTQEVGRLLAFGKESLEAAAFATGTGSQPQGIVTALAGTASELNAAADDTFAIADVRSVYNALPARHRANAAWLANNSIYTIIRGFDTGGGGGFWANLNGDRPEQLLGRDVLEAEGMDGVITTAGAVSNYILVFGDFSNYVIADRVGMTVEFIPHLFHTGNNRPSGSRGWYAHSRVGADSVNDDAFRLLDVPSAA
jgi:HK97 family phage major capsid protein